MAGAIQQSADEFADAARQREQAAADALVRAYALVRQDLAVRYEAIAKEIAALNLSKQEIDAALASEFSRVSVLLKQADDQLLGWLDAASETIRQEQSRAIAAAQADQSALAAIVQGPGPHGITATFNQLPVAALSDLLGTLQDGSPLRALLDGYGKDASKQARDALVTGLAQGQHPFTIARNMVKAMDGNAVRALTVARTETLRAYRESSLRFFKANADTITGWVWWSARTARTCPVCWAMHGSRHSLDEHFGSHPNCFVAGTVVSGAKAIGASVRWYEGDVIEIVTASGNLITVTPNHPILTPHGWINAGAVREGGEVISTTDREGPLTSVNPHEYQNPALIEDVACALRRSGGVRTATVPTSPVDFHGDGGGDAEISVVWPNGLLWDAFNTAMTEPLLDQEFVSRDMEHSRFPGLRALALAFKGINRSSPSSMGSDHEVAPLLTCPACGKQTIGVGAVAHGYTGFNEGALDSGAGYPVPSTEDIRRYAGSVFADQIVKVRRYPFANHVYNLQTPNEWYIANGIITHNCRCTMLPITKTWAEMGFGAVPGDKPLDVPSGEELFAKQPPARQKEILGPAKYKAWQDGSLTLGDLVKVTRDPDWGPTRTERSLKDALARHSALNDAERKILRLAGTVVKTVMGQSSIYELPSVAGSELQVVARADSHRAVATFLVPASQQGKGHGSALLLAALRDGDIAMESFGGVSAAYRGVQHSLVRRGFAEIVEDQYGIKSLRELQSKAT